MSRPLIALLGRKDEPTDAVEEYCHYLAGALESHAFDLQIRRVQWEKQGWQKALKSLRLQAAEWSGSWVIVQYTALAWSAHGFPQKILRVIRLLKSSGARVAIVFHDVEPYPGTRFVDRFRCDVQVRTMRWALGLAELAIFTVPPNKLTWLAEPPANAAFIPVGANLPIFPRNVLATKNKVPTIGVFSITGGKAGAHETKLILGALRYAARKLGALHLSVFGRHAELRETELRQGLQDCPVQVSVEGVVEPEQVVQKLCASDLLLFVRGPISSRRSSAIAAIACGLPVIAFSGSETAAPITEAGVVLVPTEQPNLLHEALVRVLIDPALQEELASRSRAAYQLHFSWIAIGARLSDFLNTR
jgi:glycosyltransferase involved in cell wall biosynthesis